MPSAKYLKFSINDQQVDLESVDDVPISISYALEDGEDFQKKKSGEAFDISIPATPKNSQIANSFHNPAIEDLTADAIYSKPVKCVIEANGYELLIGKAFLTSATHTKTPVNYNYDCYGDNADWVIDLKEATLYDFLKHINFIFTKQQVIDSWAFDGRDESLPYVFAPVRYRDPMDEYPANLIEINPPKIPDFNMKQGYMKPSISPYWIIYWAFKSVGYKISSNFFDTDYFRRAVMPWTWGSFLYSEGTKKENLKFLAKSTEDFYVVNKTFTGYIDTFASDNPSIAPGAFDNNNVFSYNSSTFEMRWMYLNAFAFGNLDAFFSIQLQLDAVAVANSDVEVRVAWFLNGNPERDDLVLSINAPSVGRRTDGGIFEVLAEFNVNPGDVISAKVYVHTFSSSLGRAYLKGSVLSFQLEDFKVPVGTGTVNFEDLIAFKKYKFLDMLRGIIDYFNITPKTDPVSKVVLFEPTHPYALDANQNVKQAGYFNGNFIDWSLKQDLSKESKISLYSDGDREMLFKLKDDGSDGILKKVQERIQATVGVGKYLLPERFKSGRKEIENRFFSPVMHYDVEQWKGLGSDPAGVPQMICLIPENVSNTSRDEAVNTFNPKLAWYKGLDSTVGWKFEGLTQSSFPFMFAVNYKNGGENDPIFSYSDERIGINSLGVGLLKRFFLQRMANMRGGKIYATHFLLNNNDVTNWYHREHKICNGQKWELLEINNYKPLAEETTACVLRKVSPVSVEDAANVYPATNTVLDPTAVAVDPFDMKYNQLKCLPSDIPQ